jgi:hypothetical protein
LLSVAVRGTNENRETSREMFLWSWTPGLIVWMAPVGDSTAKPDFHVITPCLRLLHDYSIPCALPLSAIVLGSLSRVRKCCGEHAIHQKERSPRRTQCNSWLYLRHALRVKGSHDTWEARSTTGHRQGEDCLPASDEMIEEYTLLTGGVGWHVDGLQAIPIEMLMIWTAEMRGSLQRER